MKLHRDNPYAQNRIRGYGPGEIRVNSDHHMAVNQLAPLFRVSAKSPDGVIECYESVDDDWFCLGVQWHPENFHASGRFAGLFEAFVKAAESRR